MDRSEQYSAEQGAESVGAVAARQKTAYKSCADSVLQKALADKRLAGADLRSDKNAGVGGGETGDDVG